MGRLRDGLLSRGGRNPKAEMPFLEHLEELRWRILWSLLAVVLGFAAGLILVFNFDVMEILLDPGQDLLGDEWLPLALSPIDNFFFPLKVGLLIGLILASPTLVYQAWAFLAPALEKHEKRAIVPALYLGLVLFVAGVAMAYFVVLPLSFRFLVGIGDQFMAQEWTANLYFGFIVQLLLAMGLVFELPVVILVLSVLGVVTPRFLRTKRRHAVVAGTILASVISPGDMLVATVVMTASLILLYEFSIFLSVLVWRKREDRDGEPEAAGAPEDAVAAATPYNHGDPARQEQTGASPVAEPNASEPSDTKGRGVE